MGAGQLAVQVYPGRDERLFAKNREPSVWSSDLLLQYVMIGWVDVAVVHRLCSSVEPQELNI